MTDAAPPIVVVVDEEVTIIEVVEEETVLLAEDAEAVVLETPAEQGIPGSLVTPTTDQVAEGSNLYFTAPRALAAAPAETGTTLGVLNAAATTKGSLVDADTLPITDTEAANVLKKVTVAVLRTAVVTLAIIATRLAGASTKAAPVDADTFVAVDSEDSNNTKRVTLANLKTTIRDYYNTVSATLTNKIVTALSLSAGTVSAPPLAFVAGTDLTVPVAGAMEFDGNVFKLTTATGRGVVPPILFAVQANNRAALADTAENPIFTDAGAAGTLALPVGTYQFDMCILVTKTSTSANTRVGFQQTGAMTIAGGMRAFNGVAAQNQTSAANTWVDSFSYTALTQLSGTTQGGCIQFRGVIRVTSAGNLIPSIVQSASGAAVTVRAGSYLILTPVGTGAAVSQGIWS